MGKKSNTDFLAAYIELESACNRLLGTKRNGVTEYINRLNNLKSAPEREEVLPKLVSYRNIRNRIAHEEGALADIKDVDKSDVRWLSNFKKSIEKRRDPISGCIKHSKRNEIMRLIKTAAIAAVAVAVAAVILAFII